MWMNCQFILLQLFLLLLSSVLTLDLRTGTIYKVQCQITGKVYIGSTIRGIEKAMIAYKSMFKSYKRGPNHFNFSIFEVMTNYDYNVTILEEINELANDTDFLVNLNKRQRYYIDKYDNAGNKVIPTRSEKEWREVNHDYLMQQQKEYREENREAELQKAKLRRDQNVSCQICNTSFKKSTLWSHNKSIRHLTALTKLCGSELSPLYQQQLFDAHMETCYICGVKYTKTSLWNHNKSVRHLTALAKLNSGAASGPQYQEELSRLLKPHEETCEVCGGEYAKRSVYTHKKSIRHLTALAKVNHNIMPASAVS